MRSYNYCVYKNVWNIYLVYLRSTSFEISSLNICRTSQPNQSKSGQTSYRQVVTWQQISAPLFLTPMGSIILARTKIFPKNWHFVRLDSCVKKFAHVLNEWSYRENVNFDIIVFSCFSSTKSCLRSLFFFFLPGR